MIHQKNPIGTLFWNADVPAETSLLKVSKQHNLKLLCWHLTARVQSALQCGWSTQNANFNPRFQCNPNVMSRNPHRTGAVTYLP
jgi:hypothetical protein